MTLLDSYDEPVIPFKFYQNCIDAHNDVALSQKVLHCTSLFFVSLFHSFVSSFFRGPPVHRGSIAATRPVFSPAVPGLLASMRALGNAVFSTGQASSSQTASVGATENARPDIARPSKLWRLPSRDLFHCESRSSLQVNICCREYYMSCASVVCV